MDLLSSLLDLFPSHLSALPIDQALLSVNQFFNCQYLTLFAPSQSIINRSDLLKKKATLLRQKFVALKKEETKENPEQEKRRGGIKRDSKYKDQPEEDFKEIDPIPGERELSEGETNSYLIRKMPEVGDLVDKHNYLDIQFRLLFEDAISDLRGGLSLMRTLAKQNAQLSRRDLIQKAREASIKIHDSVYVNGVEAIDGVACIQFKISVNPKRFVDWRISKKLLPGSLVIVSSDNFKSYFVGILKSKDAELMNKTHRQLGYVPINIQIIKAVGLAEGQEAPNSVLDFIALYQSAEFQILESSAYFESYHHVLKQLKEMDSWVSIPFSRNIINGVTITSTPLYNIDLPDNNEPQIESYLNDIQLDPSQRLAMKHALTNELALIQGPPGTGKTYVGVQIVKYLIQNRSTWRHNGPLLLVTYTNHALSQFLLLIKQFTKKIVRVGGKAQDDELSEFGLKELLYKQGLRNRNLRNELDNAKLQIQSCQQNFTMCQAGIVSMLMEGEDASTLVYRLQQTYLANLQQCLRRLRYSEQFANLVTNHINQLIEQTNSGVLVAFWLGVIDLELYLIKLHNDFLQQKFPIQYKQQQEGAIELSRDLMRGGVQDNEVDKDLMDERLKDYNQQNASMPIFERFLHNHSKLLSLYTPDTVTPQIRSIPRPQQFEDCMHQINSKPFDMQDLDQKSFSQIHMNNLRILDPFSMPQSRRWTINNYIIACLKGNARDKMWKFVAKYEETQKLVEDAEELNARTVFNQADIVAMTTTGRSKYSSLLKGQQFPIVIVEEAAEVFEAHVITSLSPETQHLILIGDHFQLKPNPSVYNLSFNFNLSLSLFERAVKNQIHHATLSHQRRMRPEISKMMRLIYPELQDHQEVITGRPQINGISASVYFFDHKFPEENNDLLMTKVNIQEAQMIVRFAVYLLQHGYLPEKITILTLYAGQLLEIKKMTKEHPLLAENYKKLRVCNVDNFQGEENDIILLSLVRSNPENKIGFLEISNRVCVALSRARMGLYIFGNATCLLSSKLKLWTDVVDYLKANNFFGTSLKFQCKDHKIVTEVKCLEDFHKVPEGGCSQICKMRLPCGHSCESACHPYEKSLSDETGHGKIKCVKPCTRETKCGHQCSYPCFECKTGHRDCITKVQRTMLPCNHTITINCSQNVPSLRCPVPCEKILGCGHKCQQACSQPCGIRRCKVTVERKLKCGHIVEMDCSANPESFECYRTCGQLLKCEHPCEAKCHECKGRGYHDLCKTKCGRALVCGHACDYNCTKSCPPCTQKCKTKCPHSKCSSECSKVCQLCQEPCKNACPHTKCTKLCSEPCNREPCNEKCDKKLKCGHPCIGLCGEKCPKVCKVCQPQHETFQVFLGNEEEQDAAFVQIDCGHIFAVEDLDNWMSLQSAAVKYKECPRCKSLISECSRYQKQINETLNDINRIKGLILQENEKMLKMFKEIRAEADKLRLKLESISYLSIKYLNQCALKIAKKLPLIITRAESERSTQTGEGIIRLLEYLNILMNIESIRKNIPSSQSDQYSAILQDVDRNAQLCTMKLSTLNKALPHAKAVIDRLKKDFPAISLTEMQEIMKAVGYTASHWNKCPNGHYYVIADCGGAMEESKCPDCGSVIGGANHALAAGNEHASELGGRPAWDPNGFDAQVADGRINLQEQFGQ
ncbi:hypothetical protein FGO68_gene11469 [Halteria grandinella]|uniref:RZ-type domain-containing protein n=1 Tax=Halteria grandinella TaxID=5974 RepID=A0A8J8T9Q9_HALGN|nr:hypothetical protein FGO68_gene11469 [Halteria grandinella]